MVTIQGKLGAVSILRRSTAQNSGVNRCASFWFTFAWLSIRKSSHIIAAVKERQRQRVFAIAA